MQAWRVEEVGEPTEVLRIDNDVAPPPLAPGFIRVRVAATGVGLPDLLMCRDAYALTPPRPFTPGQEVVGRVIEADDHAKTAVGARVMGVTAFFIGHGGFADECLMLDDFALPVPDAMSDVEAAGFSIAYHTAYVGLIQRAKIASGETLLVLGAAGGTGQAAVQLGKALGARVIAVAGGSDKCAFTRELGADETIDYRSEDITESAHALTDGHGVDVVWDSVGGDAFDRATRAIAPEGRLLLIGFASGRWGTPRPEHMAMHNYSVVGVIPSSYDRDYRLAAQKRLLALWSQSQLHVSVHERFAFEDLPAALTRLGEGGVMGKLVVRTAHPPD
jgi:NADPH2:quinone reductase